MTTTQENTMTATDVHTGRLHHVYCRPCGQYAIAPHACPQATVRLAFPYAVQVYDLSGFTVERYATQEEAMAVAEGVVAEGRTQALVSVTVSGTLAAQYVARWYEGERIA